MSTDVVKKAGSIKWVSRWAGSYTFISCSYWGLQYYYSLKKILGQAFDKTLFIHHRGTASFYAPQDELAKLGKDLADRAIKNPKWARVLCNRLKQNTDVISAVMKKFHGQVLDLAAYREFHRVFDSYLPYHVFVKKTVDYLSPSALKKFLPYFNDARLYAEKTYSETERFWRSIMKAIAKQEDYNADALTCLTQAEFEKYLKNGQLPKESVLKKRFAASALYFADGHAVIVLGNDVKLLEKLILQKANADGQHIRGISAYPGKVTGRCRVVLDPFRAGRFKKGDILVTGMTRPEFMPFIKKASAIVTDVGGILCHAAITAREVKIPCIVGTAVATKIFKDGDYLEVDATNGVIKKLT